MTHAERQARYRANHVAGGPKVRYRKPADRRSRPQRWHDAVAELTELQAEYQTWRGSKSAIFGLHGRPKAVGF
jgi:hypothetical protein